MDTIIFVIALILAFYMAWNMGANDVANAMGTSVGSGALTLKRALVVAAVLEFAGAFFVGSEVSETIESGILRTGFFENQPYVLLYGMLASLLAAGVWLQFASFFGWPVSTTHSLIGALVGFGLVVGGVHAVQWRELLSIVLSWVVSPLLGAVLSYGLFTLLRKKIFHAPDPFLKAKRLAPLLVFLVFFLMAIVIVYDGLAHLHLDLPLPHALAAAFAIAAVAAGVTFLALRRCQPPLLAVADSAPDQEVETASRLKKAVKHLEAAAPHVASEQKPELKALIGAAQKFSSTLKASGLAAANPQYQAVERLFAFLQILSACCMAFAHGANDVANSIGPLASIVKILRSGTLTGSETVPAWILALGGLGIVMGLATWGWRVIETIGKKITELTPTRGFSAEFGAAVTILFASKLGLPISTTHTLVGAVLGVGMARGIDALNLGMIRDICVSWVVTVPTGALLSILFYYMFSALLSP